MSDRPLLSFCIFTYNRALLLTQLLDQIVVVKNALPAGTIEVVISDNCSTDGTAALVRERYAEHGFKVAVQERNIGGSRNWLAAINLSSGIYVWPYGDDDLIDIDGVLHTIRDHLQRGTADFYRTNFVMGWYTTEPRLSATMTQVPHCIDCDMIFPDIASLIPYCGTMLRGIITMGNIFRGELVRGTSLDDFLPVDNYLDQVEVLLKAFKHRRSALLHRYLMLHLVPQAAPRWHLDFEAQTPGRPGLYIWTILTMRRMVRMIENGTIASSLIKADGLLRAFQLPDNTFVTQRIALPHHLASQSIDLLHQLPGTLDAADLATIGAFAGYCSDPAIRMLFDMLQRLGGAPDDALLGGLLAFQPRIIEAGTTNIWRADSCQGFDRYVGKDIDTSGLGIHDTALAAD